jgi:DNA-binding response OmpR family regulator
MKSFQNATNQQDRYQDSHLIVDFQEQTAQLDGQLLDLTQKEFDLLAILVGRAGELIPRPMLLMLVWGYGVEIRTRTLDVHIRRLRKNLGSHATRYIETVFGIGYRFQPSHRSGLVKVSPAMIPLDAQTAAVAGSGVIKSI